MAPSLVDLYSTLSSYQTILFALTICTLSAIIIVQSYIIHVQLSNKSDKSTPSQSITQCSTAIPQIQNQNSSSPLNVEPAEMSRRGHSRQRSVISTADTQPSTSLTQPQSTPCREKRINNTPTPFQHLAGSDADPDAIFSSIRPIGFASTPFRKRALIPRQSQMCPAQCVVTLRKEIQPHMSMTGIEEYSHCWVIFTFHANTNVSSNKRYIKTMINPPRSPNKKYGIYATRTPHRHNNIGLSLAKIISWEPKGSILTLQGLDLLDQTPILDIKPIHPTEYATFMSQELLYPSFVSTDLQFQTQWLQQACDSLEQLFAKKAVKSNGIGQSSKSTAAATPEEYMNVLDSILQQQDPRSQWQKGRSDAFFVELYNTRVQLSFDSEQNITTVEDIELISS